jgi:hypothetical protein
VPGRTRKDGRQVQREAPVNRLALFDLPSELVEEIIMRTTHLEDIIALSSTCRCLTALVENPSLWRRVLPKIQLVERGTMPQNSASS